MTMSNNVVSLAKTVASDVIALIIDIKAKYATKDEINAPVLTEQMIALWNGYNSSTLDYRDYLTHTTSELNQALTDLATGYSNGTA